MADMLEWFVVIGGVGLVLTAFRARSRTIARKKFLVLATSIGLLGQQIDDLNKPTAVSKAGCARLRVAGPLFRFWNLF
ncbi:hypothetical protein MJO29_011769, partial [Puccinia striiformis f. sp. tritici]